MGPDPNVEAARAMNGPGQLVIVLSALALAGCSNTSARTDVVEATMTQRLAETGAPSGSAEGRKPLPTQDFRAALRLAVEADETFRSARFAEQAALAGVRVAASGERPQFTASGMAGQIDEGGPNGRTITGASADVMLTQLVFDGGATRAGIDVATARAIAARAKMLQTGNTVALDAYNAWTDLWLARQQMALLRARTDDVATIAGQIGRMTASGMIDASLREGAELAQIDIQMEETRLVAELAAAEATFERFFGAVPATIARPVPLMPESELAAAARKWQESPALREAAAELVAAEAETEVARAALKPTISLGAGVVSPMDPEETTDTSVGFQVRYTFNDGGRRRAQIDAAEAQQAALRSQLADAQVQAQALVKSSLAQMAALNRSLRLINDKAAVATTRAETAKAQITLGQSTLSSLLETQIASYRTTEDQLRLNAESLRLQAEIAAGTGQLLSRLGIDG